MLEIIDSRLADRIFGASNFFQVGILIMLGHISLVIPSDLALFFVFIISIVLNTDLLNPNLISIESKIYEENDDLCSAGISISMWQSI